MNKNLAWLLGALLALAVSAPSYADQGFDPAAVQTVQYYHHHHWHHHWRHRWWRHHHRPVVVIRPY